jgi:AraC-like DNA-binding protein
MIDRFPARLAIVHMLPAVAAAHGVDHRQILASVGVDGGHDGWTNGVVARARIAEVLTTLARRTGDAMIGLDLARAADPGALGPPGLALGAGRTLGQSLLSHIRQMPALQGGVSYRLERSGASARLTHRLWGGTAEEARVLNEGVASFIVGAIRGILGDDRAALHVTLPHRPLACARDYDDRLGAAVTFRAGDGIVIEFDAALLDQPNRRRADGPAAPALPLDRDSGRIEDEALITSLDLLFVPAAMAGQVSVECAARSLGLSPRSLQRRLAALGTSYERQLDDWRHRSARQALAVGETPIQTIARGLGYADAAHFIRAFHRWERSSPAAWRKARRADPR